MVKPDESAVLDETMQCRRNRRLRWAGIAVAFANLGICYLAVFVGPIRGSALPILSNGSNFGWLVTIMAFFAIVQIPITLLHVLVCLLVPSLRCRGGMATVVLALLPWVEWTAMFVFLSLTVHS
jgi:hypothetical protein